MKRLLAILIVLICIISLGSCKTEKNGEKSDKVLNQFLNIWNGKEDDSRYELNIVELDNEHIKIELFEDSEEKYEYTCVLDKVTSDSLILKYEKMVLTFKILDNEMIYTKSIDGAEGIEGTNKPIRFDKQIPFK